MNYLDDFPIIKCPKCGHQYLPEEIYIPNKFFGIPKNIEYDKNGEIIFFTGQTIDPEEEFICDYCDTEFKIKADIKFQTNLLQEEINNIKIKKQELFND